MATEKICIHCVYFPLCHAIWNVCATHPCKHIGGGSVGFFRPKADEERIRREAIEECQKIVRKKQGGLNSLAEKQNNIHVSEACEATFRFSVECIEEMSALADPRPESRSVVLDAKCESRGNESHKEES